MQATRQFKIQIFEKPGLGWCFSNIENRTELMEAGIKSAQSRRAVRAASSRHCRHPSPYGANCCSITHESHRERLRIASPIAAERTTLRAICILSATADCSISRDQKGRSKYYASSQFTIKLPGRYTNLNIRPHPLLSASVVTTGHDSDATWSLRSSFNLFN
jgi:hypothetical protein